MRGSRTVSTIACASVQASWTLGNCFLNMFLNIVDTLIGAGVYRTPSPRRAHPLPKTVLLYTNYVRSAAQFDALRTSAALWQKNCSLAEGRWAATPAFRQWD